ncbi:DUF559 domain-containing protein [Rhodopseudomonas palustris]|nr:DUF559 domain-containing protein [Rhodopseudomonas palustris]
MIDDRQRYFAQMMRQNPTDAERVLWQRLRHDLVLANSHFRRQVVIGPFIVDFASRGARLVIELDGGQHDEQRAADEVRSRYIEAQGYRVLRFWNNDVLGNLDGVLAEIQSALTPTPDPSPQGEGSQNRALPASRAGAQSRGDELMNSLCGLRDGEVSLFPRHCAVSPPPCGEGSGWGAARTESNLNARSSPRTVLRRNPGADAGEGC